MPLLRFTFILSLVTFSCGFMFLALVREPTDHEGRPGRESIRESGAPARAIRERLGPFAM
jgi:hypothetical protein